MRTIKHTTPLLHLSTAALVALLFSGSIVAQSGLIKRAHQRYSALSYNEAAELYERAAKKGGTDDLIASELGDSYWRMRDMQSAERWYAKAAAQPAAKALDVYRYSETLRSNGKFELADKEMDRYRAMMVTDTRGNRQKDSRAYAEELRSRNFLGAQLRNLEINTDRSDMGAAFLGNQVTFASARKRAAEKRKHTWNGEPFLDIYIANAGPNGDLTDPARLEGPFNSKYHDSNTSCVGGCDEVWFTRNNYEDHTRIKDSRGVTGLKLFSVTRTGEGSWSAEKPFSNNSNEFSVGHPALSSDGQRLYYASNRSGGRGGTDIWYSDRNADGSWGASINAGEQVNTEGNEMFPFAGLDGLFFFSSDGHKGLGGLDVMMATSGANGMASVRNLGAPINSGADDFSFVIRPDGLSGYLTSDRPGGHGSDDIYAFNLKERPGVVLMVKGVARDGITKAPLSDVIVQMKGPDGKVLGTVTTALSGEFEFPLEPNMSYTIDAEKEQYTSTNTEIAKLGDRDTLITRNLELLEMKAISLWLHVTDARTGVPLAGVETQLIEEPSKKVVMEGPTDASGDIRSALPEKTMGDDLNLRIRLAREGYLTKKLTYSEPIKNFGEVRLHEVLDVRLQPVEVGNDLGKLIDIQPIYFDLGKHNIRKDAKLELDKIVAVLSEYPKMVIELGSHTDCRSSVAFNEALSDRRAKSSAAYIVSKGIDKDRVTGKGYGESKLVTSCPCEGSVKSPCSEEDHQLNRRTEFIIQKM